MRILINVSSKMAEYTLVISKTAQRQLNKLTDTVAELIIETVQSLASNPRPPGCKKLKGRSGYRIRKGNYRIIYEIYDDILTIEVIALGDRKEIYN